MVAIPYLLYQKSSRYRDLFPKSLENNIVADWYRSPWNEQKYKTYLAITSFDRSGLVSGYFNYLQALDDDRSYFARYGMTYDDIRDPTKLRTTSAANNLGRSYLNFVSSNINRLYR